MNIAERTRSIQRARNLITSSCCSKDEPETKSTKQVSKHLGKSKKDRRKKRTKPSEKYTHPPSRNPQYNSSEKANNNDDSKTTLSMLLILVVIGIVIVVLDIAFGIKDETKLISRLFGTAENHVLETAIDLIIKKIKNKL